MSRQQPLVRIAPGVPFGLRFIAAGGGFFAVGVLLTALTGGEIMDKATGQPMTAWAMTRLAAALTLGSAALWWTGGWLRRVQALSPADRDPM